MRTWWEDEFHQPSLGNPLFENVTPADMTLLFLRRNKAKGVKVGLDEHGQIIWGDQVQERRRGKIGQVFTGDSESDTWERRMALGLSPFEGG